MEERIPRYDIDFNLDKGDHFFLHVREKTDTSQPEFTEPHSHNYYCISVLYEGRMSYFADTVNAEQEGPALLLLNIDQVHVHTPMRDCKVISMAFSHDFILGQNRKLNDDIESVFSQPHISLSDDNLTELDKYIQLIVLEHSKGKDKDPEIIKSLLTALLIRCSKLRGKGFNNGNLKKTLFSDFNNLVKNEFKTHHQVKFYADQLNITPDVLTQAVRAASGKTPKQLIDERLLTEAKRLLYWSDSTAREVAWKLGFETDGYFNRFFKKHTGQTPKEYQKTVQDEPGMARDQPPKSAKKDGKSVNNLQP